MNSLPELNTRRMKRCVKKEIPQFLKQGPIIDKGLCIGNFLSWVLAGIYLLPLDYKIQRPFLRIQDDYLIFCKNQNEPQKILKELIEPELKKLELKINILKLKSGKFHQDKVNFLGFNFYAGYFTIYPVKCCSAAILPKAKLFNWVNPVKCCSAAILPKAKLFNWVNPDKKQEFRKRIIKLTHLTNKKQKQAIIKSINNKILGFGHYYKFASCKRDFEELDAFIRHRLRRWLVKQKLLSSKQGNLVLSNEILKTMGLKSLIEIKKKFDLNKLGKNKKLAEKKQKKGYNNRTAKPPNLAQLEEIEYSPC